MTQEEQFERFCDKLQSGSEESEDSTSENDAFNDEDRSSVLSNRSSAVKGMIMRFERGLFNNESDEFDEEEFDLRRKPCPNVNTSSAFNSLHANLSQLYPSSQNQGRLSNISVNSILSEASEVSIESSSSGIGSDRRSGIDVSDRRSTGSIPHRPAPPPPVSNQCSLNASRTSLRCDEQATEAVEYPYSSPCPSPRVSRRSRQPPVMRRKSLADGVQEHLGEFLWTYGVNQSDLNERLKHKFGTVNDSNYTSEASIEQESCQDISCDEDEDGESAEFGKQSDNEEISGDARSTDRSSDTLVNGEEGDGDDLSVVSGSSGQMCDFENISIKSVSSFDKVPAQTYDSITVSSDEFGSRDNISEKTGLMVESAVNDLCVFKSSDSDVFPVESKKEKYRRRLSDRVKELLHTERVYVEKLQHVVEDYIPRLCSPDTPAELRTLKPEIFANIERIYNFHAEELMPALHSCENDLIKLGQCFRQYEHKFNMYIIYSRNNKRANRLVYENKAFFQEIQTILEDRLDLSSYLLEPVQRIPRYKLFLDDLVKTYTNYENERCDVESRISKLSTESDETGGSNGESSDNEETPLQSLKQAKSMVESLLTTVDNIIALENIRDCPINLLTQGRLLRQYEFLATDATRRKSNMRVFLFEKVVLLTIVYKKQLTVEIFLYRDHIPVDDLGITPKEHDRYKFTIWYKKRTLKSYKLETSEASVRTAWVEEIMSLLWKQAMRKKEMLLESRRQRKSVATQPTEAELNAEASRSDDKYMSLRGVPGEKRHKRGVASSTGATSRRRTTWYCE